MGQEITEGAGSVRTQGLYASLDEGESTRYAQVVVGEVPLEREQKPTVVIDGPAEIADGQGPPVIISPIYDPHAPPDSVPKIFVLNELTLAHMTVGSRLSLTLPSLIRTIRQKDFVQRVGQRQIAHAASTPYTQRTLPPLKLDYNWGKGAFEVNPRTGSLSIREPYQLMDFIGQSLPGGYWFSVDVSEPPGLSFPELRFYLGSEDSGTWIGFERDHGQTTINAYTQMTPDEYKRKQPMTMVSFSQRLGQKPIRPGGVVTVGMRFRPWVDPNNNYGLSYPVDEHVITDSSLSGVREHFSPLHAAFAYDGKHLLVKNLSGQKLDTTNGRLIQTEPTAGLIPSPRTRFGNLTPRT